MIAASSYPAARRISSECSPSAGRLARAHLGRTVDPDRAVDGQHGVVLEGHHDFVVDHLLIVRNVVEDADHAEHQPVAVEQFPPFGKRSGREHLVENLDQLDRARVTIRLGGKARVRDEILATEDAGERRPLPVFVEQRQDNPAVVLAAIVVGHRVQRALARPPFAELGAAQLGLRQHGGGPDAVRHQVRRHMRTLAGALALIQRGDDRAVERHRAGMVAHAGDRARRRGVDVGAHEVHQAGARPIGVAVEARLVGLLALLAIAGERGVDQPLVLRREMIVGDAELRAHLRRIVGDEDVDLLGELVQHRLSFRLRRDRAPGPRLLRFSSSHAKLCSLTGYPGRFGRFR